MNTNRTISSLLALVALAIINLQPLTARATVTFTITPNVVSNTYNGQILYQIAGLTAGSTVVVQKFIDANTNRILDNGDWLVQQFNMTDGQPGMVINNVTNINVPGDTDGAANGTITAKLNFQGGDFAQNFVGDYVVKVSGNFTPPLTNVFTVTNFPWPQKFTGTVFSNSTTTVVSNAMVMLMNGQAGNGYPVAGAVANNSGVFNIQVPVGTYTLFAFRSNYVVNFNGAPTVALGSGLTVTNNLYLTNATSTISGKVVDANNANISLPGVMVHPQSTNGLMAVGFTDTNGNFTVGVQPGQWNFKPDDTTFISHGYLGLENGTNVNAGATLTNGVPKATALIYGCVVDSLGNPFRALDVYANDTVSNLYQTDAYTDTNGNYVLGVMGFGSNDPWWMQANGNGQLTNYVFSSQNTLSVATGQAVQQNFFGILATNCVVGNVKCNGTNLVGLSIWGNATINGTNYQTGYTLTDKNGNYAFNVCNGSWSIGVNCQGGSDSLDGILGAGKYACPNNQSATISNNNATNNFNVLLCNSISIAPTSPLPVGEINVYYNQTFQASDCNGTYNWSQTGGSLPGNLSLNPNGSSDALSGYPNSSGNFNFTLQVNDGSSNTTNRQYSVAISNAVQVITTNFPNGTNGFAYSQLLRATNGVPYTGTPYSWSVSSGAVPPNLNLSASGLLSGTAATNGTFNFTVQAMDSLGGIASANLSLVLSGTNYPTLCIGNASGQFLVFWPASCGTNYNLQMTTNLATGPWVAVTNCVPQVAFTVSNKAPAVFFRLQ